MSDNEPLDRARAADDLLQKMSLFEEALRRNATLLEEHKKRLSDLPEGSTFQAGEVAELIGMIGSSSALDAEIVRTLSRMASLVLLEES